jgi:hypothetical protein
MPAVKNTVATNPMTSCNSIATEYVRTLPPPAAHL